MTDKPIIQAAAIFTGRFQPEELSQIIQLVPTKTWRKGDSVQSTKLTRDKDGWEFSVARRETHDTGALLTELLDTLDPHMEKILRAAEQFHLEVAISIGIYIRGETPACWLNADIIHRISALRASLDVDLILTE